MPAAMRFHQKTVSPVKRPMLPPTHMMQYQPPKVDPKAELAAAKANELLNYRSANISHIMAQRAAIGEWSNAPITLPTPDPRMEKLHKDMGIDKVVLVTSPFNIDTTPGGFYKNQELHSQDMAGGGKGKLRDSWAPGFRDAKNEGPARESAVEYSASGTTCPASVNGRLLRGGWAVD